MLRVAKLVIIDKDNNYLLLYRNNHPFFGDDADLPGGILEDGEKPLDTMTREVQEELQLTIDPNNVRQVYEGAKYSLHGSVKTLYETKLDTRPTLKLSWEHKSFEWLPRKAFLEKCKNAEDTFMHMVYKELK